MGDGVGLFIGNGVLGTPGKGERRGGWNVGGWVGEVWPVV